MKFKIALIIVCALFSTSLQAGNFRVDKPASEILVDSKATPPHTVTSYVRDYLADIQINQNTLDVISAKIAFKLSDLDSEHEKRDEKMHSWMESAKFPEVVFNLTSVSEVDGQKLGKGTLSMHGVSKAVEIPFSLNRSGSSLELDGTATLSYEDWDLEIIRLFLFRVRPELIVKFHLQGDLSGK